MSKKIEYKDSAGFIVTLYALCRTEPAWAANRLRADAAHITTLETQLAEAKAVSKQQLQDNYDIGYGFGRRDEELELRAQLAERDKKIESKIHQINLMAEELKTLNDRAIADQAEYVDGEDLRVAFDRRGQFLANHSIKNTALKQKLAERDAEVERLKAQIPEPKSDVVARCFLVDGKVRWEMVDPTPKETPQ